MRREYTKIQKTREDITGRVFGRLTVVSLLGSYKNSHYWLCACECGNEVEIKGASLRCGNTTSCGCLTTERIVAASTTHGLSRTPMYGMWCRMIQRCEDANCGDYKYYGARGITVAAEWHDFPTFLKDVGERPDGRTLDRIRNDEGYGQNNFRWATRSEQCNNMRSNVKTYVEGKLLSIKEMAEKAGTSYDTMKARLTRLNYSPEEALHKPVKCGQTLEMAHAELIEIN